MKLLFLLLVLAIPVNPQQVVRPARVAIATAAEEPLNRELIAAVRSELRARGRFILASSRPDLDVGLVVAPLSTDITKCSGLTAAMVIVDLDRPNERRISLYLGGDLESLARHLAKKIEEESERGYR
jgi:hypothetical protein